ncbi:mechanosensitive ion channel family protein [Methanocella sp. MCL-LM]|uniref:mechanosensitive ion channel family protein n=1 Tax=Methanocella sp. MCL-LM TaxID=3412035 RepID=UPI003C742216
MPANMFVVSLNDFTDQICFALANMGLSDYTLNLLTAVSIVLLSVILALFTRLVLNRLAPRLVAMTRAKLDDEIVAAFNRPVQVFILAAGTYAALKLLRGLPEIIAGNLDAIYLTVVIMIAAYQLAKIADLLLCWYEQKTGTQDSSGLNTSMISFARKSVNIIIYGLAIVTVLAQLNVEITPLLASLGVAGIAVALAAQALLSNVFGAVAILTDRPYKVGDRIELSSGEYGDVIDIGLRSTRIRTLDNRIVIVPNADISSSHIYNYSEPNQNLRYTIKIGISYTSDVEKASNILVDIASDLRGALKDPAPVVYVEGFGDYSIKLVMLVWGENFRRDWDLPDRIYRQAIKRFPEEGIEIPYPITSIRYPVAGTSQYSSDQ